MTHVFVAPHPDDASLSCGGLIASLRELGQNVAIVTVFSGGGEGDGLSGYQREALGFGSKAMWPVSEAFNRAHIGADEPVYAPDALPAWVASDTQLDATQADADAAAKRFWQRSSWYRRASIHAESLAGQPVIDDLSTQGAVLTGERVDDASDGDIMARRRLEDERYALFAEASIVWLDLPDAVFRGYNGDDELLGSPREEAPYDAIRREIDRLEPQKLYLPLGIGNHVDHQLCREVGIRLLGEGRKWIMPGPEYAGIVTFYEDFPYAWWGDFSSVDDLPAGTLDELPADVALTPDYADISDQLERKIEGITLYESQLDRLFGGTTEMARQVRAHARKVALLGGSGSSAERYWSTKPI
ncbi:MAG: PIG-L deacetylase family protein [Chloroflexota bacterium]